MDMAWYLVAVLVIVVEYMMLMRMLECDTTKVSISKDMLGRGV
jgi:hypothetical protein